MTRHTPARLALDTALEEAESHHLTVHTDGSVSYPPAPGDTDGGTLGAPADYIEEFITSALALIDANPHRARAQAVADRIAHALRLAAADGADELASAQARLAAQPGLDATATTPRARHIPRGR